MFRDKFFNSQRQIRIIGKLYTRAYVLSQNQGTHAWSEAFMLAYTIRLIFNKIFRQQHFTNIMIVTTNPG